MPPRKILIEEAQKITNEIYGENEWKVSKYEGSHDPCVVEHKCGKEKTVSRFTTFKRGQTKCEECHSRKLKFDELNQRISNLTYGTYELVKLKNSLEFWVNHKSCERPAFKTDSCRFFSRGQSCACSKKNKVGRKSKKETEVEINNLVKDNENAD